MKVVIGLVSLEAGGTEYQMCLLADSLRSRGHQVTFYCLDSKSTPAMLGQFAPFNIRTSIQPRGIRLLDNSRPLMARRIIQWRRWLSIDQPDVLIGALLLPQLVLSLASLSLPLIGRRGFSWHEMDIDPSFRRYSDFMRRYHWWFAWRTLYLVCNSTHGSQSVIDREHWSKDRLRLIHNGWPEFPPIDWTSTHVAYAARGRYEKGIAGIAQLPDVALYNDVPPWTKIGIYCHPSLVEGSSNSIGLAMAHAIPIVAFDTPGNRSMLHPSSLVPKGDYRQLVRKIRWLQSNPVARELHGKWNQYHVRSYFPLATMVDRWESLLAGCSHTAKEPVHVQSVAHILR